MGLLYTLLYPAAHENWYPVRTNALASEPVEKLAQLENAVLAQIVIDVSEYNSKYIDDATNRIAELKQSLMVSIVMLSITILLLGLNVFRAKK